MATRGRYITPRTAYYIKHQTQELINIMGQSIILLKPILNVVEEDEYGKLYKESSTKVYHAPVEIKCIVQIMDKTSETFEDTVIEQKTRLTANIMRERLKTLNVYPNYGDIIIYQRLFFEIDDINDAPMLHGSPEYKYAVNIGAVQTRVDKNQLPVELDVL
jgi:hypothetical protein